MSATHGRHVCNVLLRNALEYAAGVSGVPIKELLRRAGDHRPVAAVLDDGEWSSYDQLRAILEVTAAELGGPEGLAFTPERRPRSPREKHSRINKDGI
jgi:hypothetical protein